MNEYVYSKLKKFTKRKFDDNSNVFEIGIDSLDLVEIITESETELNITISDEELLNLKTISDVIKLLESKKNAS
ncbi:phosphopantetheine-binding protein [Mesomycoplasma lagogenitalium]|uniref:Phosphopantetheine-binding protein n=1 Tax=Mesomycoplasma lagogenitalium TaxID=171286 RepID=A0ABY8LT15_9BACT|nr:phosphopantetheine-binding protein [Mesomycoplasma lagogenitalium]WGI36392.1 phosphopantetheine-binding protein [Mesomycoplasma lagogenitalium]